MEKTKRVLGFLSLIAWTLASCSTIGKTVPERSAIAWGPKQTVAKARKDYSSPAVYIDESGHVDLAWIEKEKDAEKAAVQFLSLTTSDQTPPQPVTANPIDIAPEATHSAPGLAAGQDGEIYLTWSVPKHIPNNDFAADIMLARSSNGGRSFEAPIAINDDGGTSSRGFEGITVARGGAVYLGWLDGRDNDKSRAATYFTKSMDQGKTVAKNLKIDGMACACCRVAMAISPDGDVYAGWRKVFDNDIRDIVLADSRDRGQTFSLPTVVKKDGWSFPACPHRGPSVAFDKQGRLYATWYTEGSDGQPRVLFATSDDKGKTFSKPISLHTSAISLPDQPKMVVHPDGIVLVVWEEMTGVRKGVVLRTSLDRGATFSPAQPLGEGGQGFQSGRIDQRGRAVRCRLERVLFSEQHGHCADRDGTGVKSKGGGAMIKRSTAFGAGRLAMTIAVFAALFIGPVMSGEASTAADLYTKAGLSRMAGSEAPEFALKTLDGQDLDRRSLKGKVVLLNFWATWCGPCKEEMPALERLRQSFPNRELEILAITTDNQRKAIAMFSKSLGITFPVLLDEEKEVSAMFGVRGLPTSVLIGGDGKLLARAVGPRAWDGPEVTALIQSLIKQ